MIRLLPEKVRRERRDHGDAFRVKREAEALDAIENAIWKLKDCESSRYNSLALTALEQARHWQMDDVVDKFNTRPVSEVRDVARPRDPGREL